MKAFKSIVALTLAVAFSVTAIVGQSAHFDVAGMDTSAPACNDFYQYANGGWLKANPIPAAYPAWGVGNVLNEKNRDVLHEILEAAAKNTAAKKGSNEPMAPREKERYALVYGSTLKVHDSQHVEAGGICDEPAHSGMGRGCHDGGQWETHRGISDSANLRHHSPEVEDG